MVWLLSKFLATIREGFAVGLFETLGCDMAVIVVVYADLMISSDEEDVFDTQRKPLV